MWPEYDDSYDPPVFDIPETGPILTGDEGGGFGWPDAGGLLDVLGKVGTTIGSVAKTVGEIQLARENTQFERQMRQSEQSLELTRAQGAVDVEKYRIANQTALQRMQLAASQGLDQLGRSFGLTSTSGNNSAALLMLAAAGVGLYFVMKK